MKNPTRDPCYSLWRDKIIQVFPAVLQHSGSGQPKWQVNMNILEQFDAKKFSLGVLCKRNHEYLATGKSLRYKIFDKNGSERPANCVQCMAGYRNELKQKDPERLAKQAQKTKIRAIERARKSQDVEELRRLNIDIEKFFLGKLCKKNHDCKNTGRSLRYLNNPQQCVECMTSYYRSNYQSKREEKLQKQKERYYDPKNRQKIKERSSKYHRKNAEKIIARVAEWAKNNEDKRRETRNRWKLRNPEIVKFNSKKRSFLKKAAFHKPYTLDDLAERLEEFGQMCAYCCARPQQHWDHFIPLAKGGWDSIDNLVPACQSCNCNKNAKDPYEWFSAQPFWNPEAWKKINTVLGRGDYV